MSLWRKRTRKAFCFSGLCSKCVRLGSLWEKGRGMPCGVKLFGVSAVQCKNKRFRVQWNQPLIYLTLEVIRTRTRQVFGLFSNGFQNWHDQIMLQTPGGLIWSIYYIIIYFMLLSQLNKHIGSVWTQNWSADMLQFSRTNLGLLVP